MHAPSTMNRKTSQRRAAAAVEMAVTLPLLTFLFVAGVDFARVYFSALTVMNCARNGALHASDPFNAASTPYADVEEAALADAGNLSPTPTVSSTEGVDEDGNPYVEVTVSYPFSTVTSYPGIPSTMTISRTVRMRLAPETPNMNVNGTQNGGGSGNGEDGE
ncbi:MAG: TadE/TadG family type IV pilus assembly protein [Gemmataceae bacterium]